MRDSNKTAETWRRASRLIARIGLLGMSLTFAVVGSEAVVRLIAPQPTSWMDIYTRRPGVPYFVLAPNIDKVAETGEARWRVVTDAQGHRISTTVDRRPGTSVVLALGDSFTFGNSVDYEQGFVSLLDTAAPDHRFINLAVPGYGPAQYRMVLEKAIGDGLVPDRILVGTFLGNDFHDCIWNKDLPVRNGVIGDPGGLRALIKRNSHLYRLCSSLWHKFGIRGDDLGLQELYQSAAWEEGALSQAYPIYRDEFAKISALCQTHAIDLFVCIIPTKPSVAEAAGEKSPGPGEPLDLTLPAWKARAVFEDLGVPFVDTTAVLGRLGPKQAYFNFDGHLSPAGNQAVAREIAANWPAVSQWTASSGPQQDSFAQTDQP